MGGTVPMILMRTDIGCSDSQVYDRHGNWDPSKKTFFLNEIEPSSTTYFVRHLKFDCIPVYGKLYAETARKMKEKMQDKSELKRVAGVVEESPAKRAKAQGA